MEKKREQRRTRSGLKEKIPESSVVREANSRDHDSNWSRSEHTLPYSQHKPTGGTWTPYQLLHCPPLYRALSITKGPLLETLDSPKLHSSQFDRLSLLFLGARFQKDSTTPQDLRFRFQSRNAWKVRLGFHRHYFSSKNLFISSPNRLLKEISIIVLYFILLISLIKN